MIKKSIYKNLYYFHIQKYTIVFLNGIQKNNQLVLSVVSKNNNMSTLIIY